MGGKKALCKAIGCTTGKGGQHDPKGGPGLASCHDTVNFGYQCLCKTHGKGVRGFVSHGDWMKSKKGSKTYDPDFKFRFGQLPPPEMHSRKLPRRNAAEKRTAPPPPPPPPAVAAGIPIPTVIPPAAPIPTADSVSRNAAAAAAESHQSAAESAATALLSPPPHSG